MQEMIKELDRVEQSENFIPWDDDRHAVKYLMTVFDVGESEAMQAVKEYMPSCINELKEGD